MIGNNFVDHPFSSHYCRACKLLHSEEGCAMFVQVPYMFPLIHPEDFPEQPVDSLNMLSFADDDNSQVYQLSDSKESNQPKVFSLSSGQLEACRNTMVPISVVVLRGQASTSQIRDAQVRVTIMVVAITKTYVRRNKGPSDQPEKVIAQSVIEPLATP